MFVVLVRARKSAVSDSLGTYGLAVITLENFAIAREGFAIKVQNAGRWVAARLIGSLQSEVIVTEVESKVNCRIVVGVLI